MGKAKGEPQIKKALETFLQEFHEYADEIAGNHQQERLNELRTKLQQRGPQITKLLLDIIGDSTYTHGPFRYRATVSTRDLIATALLGGNNALPRNFHDYQTLVTSALNKALGVLKAGLWPPKEAPPILVIHDDELQSRCSDLLSSSGNYDRVIREATTVLEDRMRSKCPHALLSQMIPNSTDQTGENLINKLFAPDNPVLSISEDRHQRIRFHRVLLAMVSYLRNPYHHHIDPTTEWSWAWSTVGFTGRLLLEIEICVLARDQ